MLFSAGRGCFLWAYLMIRCTPSADTVMMSALKHHKHVQPCTPSPAFCFFTCPFSLAMLYQTLLLFFPLLGKTFFFFFSHAAHFSSSLTLTRIFTLSKCPVSPLFVAPGAGKSNLFLDLEGKRVKQDQVLTGLSLYLSDVSTGDVSLQ